MNAPLIVILAGGDGRRIGGAKPLRLLGGERLIDRGLRRARPWSDDLRLSVRHPEQLPGLGIPVLLDDPNLPGPLGGLKSALRAAREAKRDLVLTIPCDVPFLPCDLGSRLRGAIGGRLAALAATGAGVHPTCALWKVEALDHLAAYAASGRLSIVGFAEAVGFARVEWDEDRFFNVNSADDLAEAERQLASEVQHIDHLPGLEPDGSRP